MTKTLQLRYPLTSHLYHLTFLNRACFSLSFKSYLIFVVLDFNCISSDPYETASSVPTPDHDMEFYARADFDTPPINAPRVIPAPDNYDSVILAEEDMLNYPVAQLVNSLFSSLALTVGVCFFASCCKYQRVFFIEKTILAL